MTRAYDARRGRAKRSIGTEGFPDNCQQRFILTAPDFRAVANPKKTSIATHPTQQTSLKFPSGIDRHLLLVAAVKAENPRYFEVDLSQDVLDKLTAYSAKNFKTLAIEGLNQSGMPALHTRRTRAIVRCGFYEFRQQWEYKVKLYT
ncbi:hypothetical protein [Microcoleus vaginatus]|uniref:hypothetical protein n=1 Tax=Microcoleus vaginatus TaxID=119532 RepID=UPI0016875BCF|nr:hypothetical protein [Microcoleus sp. FACHB-84]MBD2007443.1 hypothetical protein [Microcoleus sp. FACHB-45]